MPDRFFRSLRIAILVAAASGVSVFTMLQAQEPPKPSPGGPTPTEAPPESRAEPDPQAAAPDARPKAAPKVFTPTQEISPDQEIDFPADL